MITVRRGRGALALRSLLVVVFAAYYVMLVYSEVWRPGETGVDCEVGKGGMRVRSIAPHSPASRAGLRPDDLLVAVDRRPMATWEDWRLFRATREIGRLYEFEIERDGERSKVPVVLGRRQGDPLAALERKRMVQASLLVLVIVWMIRQVPGRIACLGGWLLAALGTAPLFPDAEMTAIWRGLPAPLGWVLWIVEASHLVLLPLLFTFLGVIPRPVFRSGWAWACVWAPAILLAVSWAPQLVDYVYRPWRIAELPPWMSLVMGGAVLAYGGGGLLVLLVNYRRLEDLQERACLRIVLAGACIGLAPLIPFLAAVFWGTLTQAPVLWFFVSPGYRHLLAGLFLAFPVSLAWAALRHRALFAAPRQGDAG